MELPKLSLEFPISLLLDLVLKSIDPGEDLDGLDILKALSEHPNTFLLSLHVLFLKFGISPLNKQINDETNEKDSESHQEYKPDVFIEVKESS